MNFHLASEGRKVGLGSFKFFLVVREAIILKVLNSKSDISG